MRPKYPQQFFHRPNSNPIPLIDRLPVSAHAQHLDKLNGGYNKITPYERELQAKLEQAGFRVISQFLMPDLDNASNASVDDLAQRLRLPGVKRQYSKASMFTWSYDLAAIPVAPSENAVPDLNWRKAFLVEVNGRHHRDCFNEIQDERKTDLAHRLLHMPVVHVRNQDVAYCNIVNRILEKAEKIRLRYRL
jgi:hypothetical protein